MPYFKSEIYNDDRLYVLHIARCTVAHGPDKTTVTTVYHERVPEDARWCLVTYRNTVRFPAIRVDHFDTFEETLSYLERVEPTVPRISIGGQSPEKPLAFEDWKVWKASNDMKEYDYRAMYLPGGDNPQETFISRNRK